MMHPLLIDELERRVRSVPDSLTFDGRSLVELRADALRVATALRERGFAGRPVLVAVPAGLDYVTCLLGCLYAGAIMVPAYPATSVRLSRANQRIAAILSDADVACALTVDTGSTAASPIEALQLQALIAKRPEIPELTWALDPDAICLLQYTSGSTSTPKGVAVSLRQLSANVSAITEATQLTSRDVMVTWLPPYHDMGLLGGIFWPLYCGLATYVLPPESFIRRPLRWLQAITERRANITLAPNFAFDLCVRRIPEAQRADLDLSSLRLLCNGAEPIHPDTLDSFATAFAACGFDRRAFYPCYGLAEATLFVAGGKPDAPPVVEPFDATGLEQARARPAASHDRVARIVGCGQAASGTTIRIVDPDSQMQVSEGQIAEIWVSGPSVAAGYWKRPDETRQKFRAEIRDSNEGPFLRTGDLGFLRKGELFVTGRLSDLIVIHGQNHYPHDIERTVAAVHPAFGAELGAAFSVIVDGKERVVVVHEIDHRVQADASSLVSKVLEAIRQLHGLSLQSCVIVRRRSVARTASGKVKRQFMRQAYLDGTLDVVARWDASGRTRALPATATALAPERAVTRTHPAGATERREAITAFLRARIAEIARVDAEEIDENLPIARYGIDSLEAASLTAALEEFLGEPLSATLSYEQPTIAALASSLSGTGKPAKAAAKKTAARGPESDRRALAIVGMSCRFPGAANLESFWELLAGGHDAVTNLPPDRTQLAASGALFGGFIADIDRFDAAFFDLSVREAARMDPQQRLFLELTWAALEDAGIPASSLRDTDAGVFAGVCTNDYALLHAGQLSLIDADYGAGHAQSVIANRVSYTLDLRGPSMTVDTACSSSLVAIHLASESLRRGECSVAIVGGVNAVLAAEPGLFFEKARSLAKDGRCKTFDASADGFVRSEGCGVIVLKRLSDAEATGDRIYARIEGSATNHDGSSNGLMAPRLPAQERLLQAALRAANIAPEQIDYIEAHGVGTQLSDAVELGALARVFARSSDASPRCHIGSVKTNVGHLEAASGIAGVIKTALALSRERIPAHLHLREVATQIDLEGVGLAIPIRALPWPRATDGGRVRFAGVSAFGFGGTNAHVVLRESPVREASIETGRRPHEMLALSAKDPTALREIAGELIPRTTEASFMSLCYSMNVGRDHFAYRAAFVANDPASLRAALQRVASGSTARASRREPRLAYVFGERPAIAGEARELCVEPAFRLALERGTQIVGPILGCDLSAALVGDERLEFPRTAGVLLQYALHALLEHWRIRPAIALGWGVGEYSAASVAGVLDWPDALLLVARRELLLKSLVPGARVRQTLHQFKAALAAIEYASPRLPLIAAELGHLVAPADALGRDYWLQHLYARPNAERALAALNRFEPELGLTIGRPGSDDALRPALRPEPGTSDRWLSCLAAESGSDHRQLLQSVAMLYERGSAVDFGAFHAGFEREKLALPSYPFQRQRCWLDLAPAPLRAEAAPQSTHPFLRARPAESTR